MKQILPILFFLIVWIDSKCQTTFNIRARYGFPACVITNVYPTDSCYYALGLLADTIPPFNAGALFLKLSLYGELHVLKTIKSPIKTYEPWFKSPNRLPNGDLFASAYTLDSTFKSFVIRYNIYVDSIFTKECVFFIRSSSFSS